jgi:predicted nucleic acid-binding protein
LLNRCAAGVGTPAPSKIWNSTNRAVPVEWPDVHQIAERLSNSYTKADGHLAFDVLHVATALHLGAREFLSFDDRQRKLARAEGLKVKP